MLISIFASIWAWNLWDELILKNEIKILKQKFQDRNPKFIVYSYDLENIFFEDESVEYREYFPIDIKNPRKILKNIKNFFVFLKYTFLSDLIVIWWWWLFFDNEVWNKKNPLDLWLFRMNFFKFFLKKIYFFRVGINIKNKNSLEKIHKIFAWKRKKIEVRDNYSLKILEDLWIENVIKKYDPVFLDKFLDFPLKKNKFFDEEVSNILNKKISIKKIFKNFSLKDLENIDFKDKKVWIAFRSSYFSIDPELEILMVKEIIEFLQKSWAKVIFLPHSFSKTDVLSNDFLWMQFIQKKTKNVEITTSLKETYDVYKNKKVDIIFAQRLHSIILSQVYEIPFIWISYTTKTTELLSELK